MCNKSPQQDSKWGRCDYMVSIQKPQGRKALCLYTCNSCWSVFSNDISASRLRRPSMTVTSWKRGAPCTPHLHLQLPPPPLSSGAPSLSLRGPSGWICPRTPPSGRASPNLYPSPRVHRVDWGSCRHRRHHNPRRRSLEWDFDSLGWSVCHTGVITQIKMNVFLIFGVFSYLRICKMSL